MEGSGKKHEVVVWWRKKSRRKGGVIIHGARRWEPPQATGPIFPVTHSAARPGRALNKLPSAPGGVVVVEWNRGFFLRSLLFLQGAADRQLLVYSSVFASAVL
jgi:hypothetical protein